MERTKESYYCFMCGKPMEELPHLPEETLLTIITRLGCQHCNIVQEVNYLTRQLGPTGHYLKYTEYQKKLKNTEK